MEIRDYRPGDLPRLQELWKLSGIYTATDQGLDAGIPLSQELGGKLFVLEDPDSKELIGSSWLSWDGHTLHLHHFAVHPDHRRLGHGRALAETSLAFARELGAPLSLEVQKDNKAAIKLYRSLGMEEFRDYFIFLRSP